MSTYHKILLVVHVGGAIIGIGPTYAFAVMGNAAAQGGPGALAVLETMVKINKVLVTPVAAFTQPVSGVLLIFESGYNKVFWDQEWLYTSIVALAVILFIAFVIDNPIVAKIVELMRAGQAGTPEFQQLVKKTSRNGPIMGALGTLIIFLMVWKPGA